jgi:two-component system sensor histidine kinase KdpD
VAGGVLRSGEPLEALVSQLRESFAMRSVVLRVEGETLYRATADEPDGPDEQTTFSLGQSAQLVLRGRSLLPADRQVLEAFLSQLEVALQRRELLSEAERMRPVAEADRLRTALLAAVGHDLRRPLAAATAAVTSLRSADVALSESDQQELLETAEVSLDALAELVTKLLDASRLQAGVLGVSLESVALDELVLEALDELALAPGSVHLELAETPPVVADPALLQRALVNVLDNALRYSPSQPPTITTVEVDGAVQLRVVDTGPGIPPDRRGGVFAAFQRLGDTDNTTGIGLGLSLSKGFVEAMGGTLGLEETPGGGLTMVIELAVSA